jgi:hypothetical protein
MAIEHRIPPYSRRATTYTPSPPPRPDSIFLQPIWTKNSTASGMETLHIQKDALQQNPASTHPSDLSAPIAECSNQCFCRPHAVVSLTPASSTSAPLRRKMCSHFVLATPRRSSSFRRPSCRDVKPSPHRFCMQWFSSLFSACTVVNRSLDLVLQKNIGSNFSITAVLSLQKYY